MSSRKTKNALVTGAGKRIGREIAIALEKAGWNVCTHYNTSKPDSKISVQADLNDFDDVKNLVNKASEKLGGEISLLINNASIFEKVGFLETSEDEFDRHMNLHVKAPYFLAQAFAKQTENGQIINIVDTFTKRNSKNYFAYLLSKKSLANLSDMLAFKLAPKILVNAIFPGAMRGFNENLDPEFLKKRKAELPQQDFASPDDVIKTILFLADSNLTGQKIYIDGGEQLI